jgi:hypothetical protein
MAQLALRQWLSVWPLLTHKTAKPKVFTPSNIEYSVIKALEPVLQARDGTIYSFSDWTLSGDGAVIVLPNGQEFWLTITEAK